jgi:hypothetical protein
MWPPKIILDLLSTKKAIRFVLDLEMCEKRVLRCTFLPHARAWLCTLCAPCATNSLLSVNIGHLVDEARGDVHVAVGEATRGPSHAPNEALAHRSPIALRPLAHRFPTALRPLAHRIEASRPGRPECSGITDRLRQSRQFSRARPTES